MGHCPGPAAHPFLRDPSPSLSFVRCPSPTSLAPSHLALSIAVGGSPSLLSLIRRRSHTASLSSCFSVALSLSPSLSGLSLLGRRSLVLAGSPRPRGRWLAAPSLAQQASPLAALLRRSPLPTCPRARGRWLAAPCSVARCCWWLAASRLPIGSHQIQSFRSASQKLQLQSPDLLQLSAVSCSFTSFCL